MPCRLRLKARRSSNRLSNKAVDRHRAVAASKGRHSRGAKADNRANREAVRQAHRVITRKPHNRPAQVGSPARSCSQTRAGRFAARV